MTTESVIGLIDEACDAYADRDCLIHGDLHLSFREVQEASCRIANGLIAAGLSKGMRGAVFSPNDAWGFVATLGIIRAGAIWAPVNPRNSLDDNLELLRRFGCHALFYHSEFTDGAARIRSKNRDLRAAICLDTSHCGAPPLREWLARQSSARPDLPADPRDVVMIPTTGGTTGAPKAVALSNRNLVAILKGIRAISDDRRPISIAAAPMTHVGGRIALAVLYRGGVSVILNSAEPALVLDAIERHRATDLFLPPTAVYALIAHARTHKRDWSSLRRIAYGAAPMSIDMLKQALDVFGPVMEGGLGQTEAPLLISRMRTEDHYVGGRVAPDERLRSVGRATPSSTVAIMHEDGTLLGANHIGEIVVKGAFVSEGYFEDANATAQVRRNGWHLTGDIGYLDDDGYLYVVDRKKDMIITGGFNVYSAEVERVISAVPGVCDCVVIGVPDAKWGEAVKAIVQRDRGADVSAIQIIETCKVKLGGVKTPKSVDFVEDLPRNANGKVVKRDVRAPYWANADRQI